MKGLLIKDFYELYKQCKFVLVLILMYIFLSFTDMGYFFSGFAIIFVAMLPSTIMTLDEKSKWESFAVTMPYSRKEMVLTKYILSVLGILAVVVTFLLISGVTSLFNIGLAIDTLGNPILVMVPMICVGVLFSSINFPIMFKIGPEKGRLFTILICAISGGIGGAYFASDGEFRNWLMNIGLNIPSYAYLILSIVILMLSYFISVKFYENRDL